MKLKNSQNGFGVVGVLVLIIVLLVVGGAGYFVWQKNDTKTSTTTSTDTQTTVQAQEGYLTITEWGVKMKTDTTLGAVTYTEGSANSITLTSDLQKTLPASCSFGTESPWGLTRTAASVATADEKAYLTYVGDYYYKRTYPQQGCEDSQEIMTKIENGFKTMFESIAKN